MKKYLMRPKKLVRGATLILRIGLPLVALELIYIAYSLSNYSGYDIARLSLYIYSMLEHVLMSLVLIVGGSLLFDIAMREAEQQKNHD
jgi:hypothetical protein